MIDELLDRPVSFLPVFARIGGSVNAGIMLSQARYWSKRTSDPEGWFYKTQEEWELETALTRYEQEGARKQLKQRGLIEEKKIGLPAKLHYRVVNDRVWSHLQQVCGNSTTKSAKQTSQGKTDGRVRNKPPHKSVEKSQAISTESTSESTSKSTASTEDEVSISLSEEERVQLSQFLTSVRLEPGAISMMLSKYPERVRLVAKWWPTQDAGKVRSSAALVRSFIEHPEKWGDGSLVQANGDRPHIDTDALGVLEQRIAQQVYDGLPPIEKESVDSCVSIGRDFLEIMEKFHKTRTSAVQQLARHQKQG